MSQLADTIAAHFNFKLQDKQQLLETVSPVERMSLLFSLMQAEIEIYKMEQRIKGRVKKQMEKTQRDYYLNEQMRAIQKEMGGKDDHKTDLDELEGRIKRKRMPKEAASKVRQEFKKLKLMAPMSAEGTVVRNYIEWLIAKGVTGLYPNGSSGEFIRISFVILSCEDLKCKEISKLSWHTSSIFCSRSKLYVVYKSIFNFIRKCYPII